MSLRPSPDQPGDELPPPQPRTPPRQLTRREAEFSQSLCVAHLTDLVRKQHALLCELDPTGGWLVDVVNGRAFYNNLDLDCSVYVLRDLCYELLCARARFDDIRLYIIPDDQLPYDDEYDD